MERKQLLLKSVYCVPYQEKHTIYWALETNLFQMTMTQTDTDKGSDVSWMAMSHTNQGSDVSQIAVNIFLLQPEKGLPVAG